jgi:translation initiation factor eIF-2B subunit delta
MLAHEDVVISGSSYAKSKLTDDDCILVYGCSSLVTQVLREAHKKFKNFKVIVVDSRPKCNGKTTLEKLSNKGIDSTYILINAVSFVMKRVTKVIIGAHALLSNGYVMSSVGSSQIALIAKAFNVPVVVCCETYKFCDKVQTDVFVNNELGNPDELKVQKIKKSDCVGDNDRNINLINLMYDVTPPDLISCVVTDMGMLPCTSVPVVLRVKNRENLHLMQTSNKNVRE